MKRLQGAEAMAARGLEFLILTASRSGQFLCASGQKSIREKAVWIVPAERMKAGKEHRVPLTPRAVAIVKALKETKVTTLFFQGGEGRTALAYGLRDVEAP